MRTTLEQVLKTEPSAAAWERMGFANFRLKDYDRSLDNFQNALKLDKDYFPALNGMGICLLNRWITSDRTDAKAHEEGVRSLRRSLQIKIDQPRIVELVSRYGA
jgi:tetratricopeptide (TPR) repeat protein